MGLFLVAGSHFRFKDENLRGMDENGRPVDATRLFDAAALAEMLEGAFHHYRAGFCGNPSGRGHTRPPVDWADLTRAMIREMGVDRHMEEILRPADQMELSQADFYQVLENGGYSKKQARAMERGKEEIPVFTGPHLGGFNRPISVPELIRAVETLSAVLVGDRFLRQGKRERNRA